MPRLSSRQWSEQERRILTDKLILGTAKRGDCTEWTAGSTTSGYGEVRVPRKGQVYAHRLAYELFNGPIPDGLMVCHRCDNPRCVNPAHLFLGTARDNVRDMMGKGRAVMRAARGERNPSAKLTAEQVREIRHRYAAGGISQRALAREYGVIQATIKEIIHRLIWQHV